MSEDSALSQKTQYPLVSSSHERLTWLRKLLELAQIDSLQWELESEQLPELCSFRLGDEILTYQALPDGDTSDRYTRGMSIPSNSNFYLICQGKIRLLSYQPIAEREVTTVVLEVNQTFGAESLLDTTLGNTVLPYRAVAASPVQLARFSADAIAALVRRFPKLQTYLQTQAKHQQSLIFFKTLTSLHRCSTAQLKLLMPYLVEQTIAAGTLIAEVAPGSAGRFWLRQGEIQSATQALSKGVSWGHPTATPNDWIASTELMVYQLPSEQWDAAMALLPMLAQPEPSTANPTTAEGQGAVVERRSTGKVVYQPAQGSPPSAVPTITRRDRAEPVAFPKPIRRHLLDWFVRYPWVEQHSSSDCGAACLAMIGQYWGKRFPVYVLREQANVGRAGASLKSLARAAEGLGFQARPVRASLGRMTEQKNPWIAHWEGNHYVVVYRVSKTQVLIADPAVGRRSLSRQAFQNSWTGYALLLDPTHQLQQTEIKQPSIGRYFGAILPYRSVIVQIILFSILIQLFGLVTPLFTQIILDRVVVQKSLSTLNVFAFGLVLFGVWTLGLTSVRQYLLSYFSNRLDLTLISGFIKHALSLPLKFFESRRVGDILTRVQENQKIQRFLIQHVVLAWLDFLTGFIYLGLMLYYNWRLTLLVLMLIPPIFLLTLAATPLLQRISREVFKETADQNSVLVETLTGIATIKSTAAEQDFRWQWEDHLTRQVNTQFRAQKLGIKLQAGSGLIHTLGSTLLLWYGATLVIQDQLTIGQFVAFNMMLGYVINPVVSLADLWDELQEVLISVERLNDVFEAKSEESAQTQRINLPTVQGNVQLVDVSFRYNEDEEQNTLQNISFDVKAGQTVAIVGRSGSGKSTLVKLIEGLYHPTRGQVFIDGHDIRHVSPHSVRSQFGIVPQDCYLFSGTILENITLHRTEYSLDQVVEAAKLAEAHAFVQALPLGYNTKVGERGSALSGGQRQRIAIARALLGNPRILILDEATSSLDTESERRFQQNLAQIRRDRTTFIIAHRLSTVRHAKTILVLDRGVLVEQGSHAELLEKQGLYYHLAQQQLDL